MWFRPPGYASTTFRAAPGQWPLYECERERAKNEQCFLSCSHVGHQCPRSSCPPVLSVFPRCCAATAVVRERVASESERNVPCSHERTSDALSAASLLVRHSHQRIILSRSISRRMKFSPRFRLRKFRRNGTFARTPPWLLTRSHVDS